MFNEFYLKISCVHFFVNKDTIYLLKKLILEMVLACYCTALIYSIFLLSYSFLDRIHLGLDDKN